MVCNSRQSGKAGSHTPRQNGEPDIAQCRSAHCDFYGEAGFRPSLESGAKKTPPPKKIPAPAPKKEAIQAPPQSGANGQVRRLHNTGPEALTSDQLTFSHSINSEQKKAWLNARPRQRYPIRSLRLHSASQLLQPCRQRSSSNQTTDNHEGNPVCCQSLHTPCRRW